MTKKTKVTFSYKENKEIFPSIARINEINDEISKIKKEKDDAIEILQQEKEKIQSNCNHHYHITATGMYDDSYECKFCGHETQR